MRIYNAVSKTTCQLDVFKDSFRVNSHD